MSSIDASIIIPVYNQYNSLKYVLKGFSKQNYDIDKFEIIIVDDGSTDLLINESGNSLSKINGLNVQVIRQENRGRSAARNIGVKNANSEYLIFCDGDRIPHINFVYEHIKSCNNLSCVTVGAAYDFFGKLDCFDNNEMDWFYVKQMSRIPLYYKKIYSKHQNKDELFQKHMWLSFLIGNSSINKQLFEFVGGFDENIKQWGFEHFELGYRLFKSKAFFSLNDKAISFHIPHVRPKGFYEEHIIASIKYLCQKHSNIDALYLYDFFGVNGYYEQ